MAAASNLARALRARAAEEDEIRGIMRERGHDDVYLGAGDEIRMLAADVEAGSLSGAQSLEAAIAPLSDEQLAAFAWRMTIAFPWADPGDWMERLLGGDA